MMFQMLPVMAFAAEGDSVEAGKARIGDMVYDTLKEAVEAAPADGSTTTIELGEGNYTLYGTSVASGKSLTFVGQGIGQTTWEIGHPASSTGGYGNGDYSLKGTGTITFQKMTIDNSVQWNYTGFAESNVTVVENCELNGRTTFWGYQTAEFKDSTFNATTGDYALWVYCSDTMTFDNCTFNANGKVIKVYNEGRTEPTTVNLKNCTVNSTATNKTAVSIDDSLSKASFTINIEGIDKINAARDKDTCSQVFGFGGSGHNTGKTIVTINGETVWQDGKMVSHKYGEGNVTTTYGDWDMTQTPPTRTVTEDCAVCGWHKETTETGHKITYDLNGGTETAGEDYSDTLRGESATLAMAPMLAGYTFMGWRVNGGSAVYPAGTKISDIKEISSADDITLEAVWEADTPDPGDDPSDSGSGDAVATAVVVTVGTAGAAVLGYYLGTELLSNYYGLPYLSNNRRELALMLWEDAGKPMPESDLLYTDIGKDEQDMDLQYAARWAEDNDLIPDLDRKDTAEEKKFDPDLHVSRARVLRAWRKAQELKKNA